MSADGKTVAIGAINNGGSGSESGHVRVYKILSGSWTQIGQDIDGEYVIDQSGFSVSLSADGTTVAIGAPYNDNGNAGHVRVYKILSGSWTQIGQDIDGEAGGDQSGWSVSLSADGTMAAIGANRNGGTFAGHVRVYTILSGSWTQIGQDIDGEAFGDSSGHSVSLSADGTTVAIGAIFNNGNGGDRDSGHVRVYKILSGSWTQIGQDINAEAVGDSSGHSVSLSADGTTVAIGAINNGGFAGHVRVYKILSGSWTQIGQDIDGEHAFDNSGYSVSLSADGTTLAIGAPFNDGSGIESGHIRVYTISSDRWTQIGQDIDGEKECDNSGYSVSLSADGTTVAIGAIGNGNYAGHVRIYKYDLPTKSPTKSPTKTPTKSPTQQPTKSPTQQPTISPTKIPTNPPTKRPTNSPTKSPTNSPTKSPTNSPTKIPTKTPTKTPTVPTKPPTNSPTKTPTKLPTNGPTKSPSKSPTKNPTNSLTKTPTKSPIITTTKSPMNSQTKSPTKTPTNSQTKLPSKYPTKLPVSQAPLTVKPVNTPASVPIEVPLLPISQPVQQIPLPTPVSGTVPIHIPTPIQAPVVTTFINTTHAPTKSPTTIIITTDESTSCGLFGLSFFYPRVGKCGFWRRLLNIRDC